MNSMCISLHHLWWQRGTVITLASIKQTSIWTQMIYINHTNGAYKMYTITASQVPILRICEDGKVVLERIFEMLFVAKSMNIQSISKCFLAPEAKNQTDTFKITRRWILIHGTPEWEIRVSHNWIIRSSGISTSFQPSRWKKNSATSIGAKKNGCKWKLSILLSKVFGSMNCSNFF